MRNTLNLMAHVHAIPIMVAVGWHISQYLRIYSALSTPMRYKPVLAIYAFAFRT